MAKKPIPSKRSADAAELLRRLKAGRQLLQKDLSTAHGRTKRLRTRASR